MSRHARVSSLMARRIHSCTSTKRMGFHRPSVGMRFSAALFSSLSLQTFSTFSLQIWGLDGGELSVVAMLVPMCVCAFRIRDCF